MPDPRMFETNSEGSELGVTVNAIAENEARVTESAAAALINCFIIVFLTDKRTYILPGYARSLPLTQPGHQLLLKSPPARGLGEFFITVEPECSSVGGIVVVSVFLVAYLALFRRQPRWPN